MDPPIQSLSSDRGRAGAILIDIDDDDDGDDNDDDDDDDGDGGDDLSLRTLHPFLYYLE